MVLLWAHMTEDTQSESESRTQAGGEASIGRALNFALQHLGVTIAVGGAATVGIRLMVVSRGNTLTARALLQHGGTTEVLLATALTVVPFLLLAVAGVAHRLARPAGSRPWAIESTLINISTVSGLAFLAIASMGTVLTVAAVVVIWAVATKVFKRSDRGQQIMHWIYGAGAIALLFAVFRSDEMWLASEQISLDDGETVAGYVLAESAAGLVVLVEGDRTVRLLDLDHGRADRELCDLRRERWLDRPLWSWLPPGESRPTYPVCDV